MATTSKSPLAVTLKQNRPFVFLQQEAFLSILRSASELSNTADKLLRQFDITQQQYNVLRILRGAGTEGLCRNEISARGARYVSPVGPHGEVRLDHSREG